MGRRAALAALLALLPYGWARANGGDQCVAPAPITSLPFSDGGTTTGATNSPTGQLRPTCSTYTTVAGPDVIYSLDLAAGNNLAFSVIPAAGYDVALYLLSTCDSGMSCVTGSDVGTAGGAESFMVSGLADGTYLLYVDSFYAAGSASAGAYTVNVTGSLGVTTTTTTTSTTEASTTSTTETTTTSTTETTTTSNGDTTTTSSTDSTTTTSGDDTTTTSAADTTTTTTTTSADTTTTSTTDTTTPSTTSTTATVTSTTTTTTTTSSSSTTTLPATTTTTSSSTTTTVPPLCANGVSIAKGLVKLTKLKAPSGNEGLLARGTLSFAAAQLAVFVPVTRGAQLLIEDLGADAVAVFDLSAGSDPIPPGGPGTGCAPGDGWKKSTYKNESNALSPPACPPGSARGLRLLQLKDRRVKGKGIAFKAVARGTTLPLLATPVGPLRLTLVLGASPEAGAAGECGVIVFAPGACTAKGQTFQCK